MAGAGGDSVGRLLEAAPWLGEGLKPADAEEAKRSVLVPVNFHDPGPWAWRQPVPAVGLLIIDGRMARGLHVDDAPAHGLEMVGDGDLLRPWTFRGASASVPSTVDWTVLSRVKLAVLDLSYVRATLRWPRIGINLLDAAVERTRTLSYFLTARQVSHLEGRVLLTLWHLADRWGHVSPDGVVLELPKLTHEMIARMVAARRPSVTTGIRALRELGVIDVQSRGRWILKGDPVEALHLVNARLPEPAQTIAID
jgi:CRP/FNR family cyclic AMP-dependent transcriptional regulator